MRISHRYTILQASIYALLLLCAEADSEDLKCEDKIQVHRNTINNVSLGESLEIACPVQFCQNSVKTITWSKLEQEVFRTASIVNSSRISTKLIMSSHLEGTSYLMFNDIQVDDSGVYWCESGDAVSFKIGVSVGGCQHEIQVQRNTIYQVSVGESLEVPCPVKFCQDPEKTITWFKLEGKINTTTRIINSSHISTKLTMSSPLEGTSYLMFNSIQANDSGVYWRESGDAVSSIVVVSVTGLNFLYPSLKMAAIVVLVIIVSAVSMRTYKRKPKEEHPRDDQLVEVPMVDMSVASRGHREREPPV